jgi:hypothetical protein
MVLRWNGSTWTTEATPSPGSSPKLYGGAAIAPNTVWAVGYRFDQGLFDNQTLTLRATGA